MELSLEERVYGLSLIWKEAEYNFPFWNRLEGLDWDKAYREALPKVTAASDMREYYLELSRFISLLRDGHTDLQFPHEVIQDAGQLPGGPEDDRWDVVCDECGCFHRHSHL